MEKWNFLVINSEFQNLIILEQLITLTQLSILMTTLTKLRKPVLSQNPSLKIFLLIINTSNTISNLSLVELISTQTTAENLFSNPDFRKAMK
jgi:hypothetical protein